MTPDLIPLSPISHRTHGWTSRGDYKFAAADACVALLLPELSAALPSYPLAFIQRPDGKFMLVAMLALNSGENLYLDVQGRWQAGYVPSHYRGYPFSLNPVQSDESRMALCFNAKSGRYREQPDVRQGETRFFDDDGKPQPVLAQVLNFLQSCSQSRQQTQVAVDALAGAGLLQPWPLPQAMQVSPSQPLLQGLYRIDEATLNQQSAEQLLSLRQANALGLAYAQLFSMSRLAVLQQLAKRRQQAPQPAPVAPDPSIVQSLFDPSQSDTMKFNW